MVMDKEGVSSLEWRINLPNGTSETLVPRSGSICRMWLGLKCHVEGILLKARRFLEKAWKLAVDEPSKVIHCVKVGVALSLVSLFYYMRPLYDGFGGNALWAVMTVVVVFEYSVGATLSKSVNRATATFIAGLLGVGVHWLATQSGEKLEPIILGFSVFLFASAATFSRFIPSVKARFDYGAMIFILTFSFVSVSGYRIDRLFELSYQRFFTIAIGTSLCIMISIIIFPIWAGSDLHNLIYHNLEKLSDSLQGSVAEYFRDDGTESKEDCDSKVQGYKCVLNSKATEESMANFASWEPPHGRFNFGHPWKQYLKIGEAIRSCACCIETLNSFVYSEVEAPAHLKEHLKHLCMTLSSTSSNVLNELAVTLKSMKKSLKIDFLVEEMNFAVQELQKTLKTLPNHHIMRPPLTTQTTDDAPSGGPITEPIVPTLIEILPLATLVSLLIENAARIEGIADAVDELAGLAEFQPAIDKKTNQSQQAKNPSADNQDH
ncbi:ALMT domain-containing protein [Cephalotus follicularis]|uniref:ALMT domain-containing protein n=1 Tax=Cephalotus follicularis TaxID=3775 RepID=A0A1Q3BTM3_CEPFO|nr:ALMT domain-containing protein [Cephalotus follicularis]